MNERERALIHYAKGFALNEEDFRMRHADLLFYFVSAPNLLPALNKGAISFNFCCPLNSSFTDTDITFCRAVVSSHLSDLRTEPCVCVPSKRE